MTIKESSKYTYSSSYEFLNSCEIEEIKESFSQEFDEFPQTNDLEEFICFINEMLNSFGWSDEEIIQKVLNNRDEYFIFGFNSYEDKFEVFLLDGGFY
jgi:predicted house-cleaning noncanonical NTP pyrophosphatase (MazG superfamily)